MTLHGIHIPEPQIADFCRDHHIGKLSLFGSKRYSVKAGGTGEEL